MGTVMLIVFLSYALGFWFGTGVVLGEYIPDVIGEFSMGDMLIVSTYLINTCERNSFSYCIIMSLNRTKMAAKGR